MLSAVIAALVPLSVSALTWVARRVVKELRQARESAERRMAAMEAATAATTAAVSSLQTELAAHTQDEQRQFTDLWKHLAQAQGPAVTN